jgi:hypothetical protein
MLRKLCLAFALMAVCVVIHAACVATALPWVRAHSTTQAQARPLVRIWLFVRIAAWMISFHLLEIGVWAAFYWWVGALPDLPSSMYFSAVTYTTTGYGDVVLTVDWRILGGVEALTGIVMCGWSTGFFFAMVSSLERASKRMERPPGP